MTCPVITLYKLKKINDQINRESPYQEHQVLSYMRKYKVSKIIFKLSEFNATALNSNATWRNFSLAVGALDRVRGFTF
jgi:hypothetical protein